MSDGEKYRIKPLKNKRDYNLLRILVPVAISARGMDKVFETKKYGDKGSNSKYIGCIATDEQYQQDRNIIVSALRENELRLVSSDIGKSTLLMEILNTRFELKKIASRISKIREVFTIQYNTLREDIGKHIDKVAGLIEKLKTWATNATMDSQLANWSLQLTSMN